MSYVSIIVTFVLVNNLVLTHFLGLCPVIGSSRRVESAFGLGVAASFVMSVGSLITWALRSWLLMPLGIAFLQTFVFVLVLAALGHYLGVVIESVSPALHRSVGKYLPLISVNCVVLGIALVASRADYAALESLVAGLAAGIGFLLAAVVVASIRERLEREWVPRVFRGTPIAFITTGLVALAFLAFDQTFLGNLVGR
ncbi:MAG: electron transport complex protein RnfA [Spirochaetota bacterium]